MFIVLLSDVFSVWSSSRYEGLALIYDCVTSCNCHWLLWVETTAQFWRQEKMLIESLHCSRCTWAVYSWLSGTDCPFSLHRYTIAIYIFSYQHIIADLHCSVKILLTLYTERYTTNFDIGKKPGHYCIWNHCIADTHELHFVKTCLFLPKSSRYLPNSEYTKLYVSEKYQSKEGINAWNGEQNVYFLLHIH